MGSPGGDASDDGAHFVNVSSWDAQLFSLGGGYADAGAADHVLRHADV